MRGMSSALLLLLLPLVAHAETEAWSLNAMLGGQGLGFGGYVEIPLGNRDSRLQVGGGESLDVAAAFVFLSNADVRRSTYLSYLHVAPAHGTRLEWALGPAYIEREYDRYFSDSRDFQVSAWALTGAVGVRTDAADDAWIWRAGIASLWIVDQPEPVLYDRDLLWRGYFSLGFRF